MNKVSSNIEQLRVCNGPDKEHNEQAGRRWGEGAAAN